MKLEEKNWKIIKICNYLLKNGCDVHWRNDFCDFSDNQNYQKKRTMFLLLLFCFVSSIISGHHMDAKYEMSDVIRDNAIEFALKRRRHTFIEFTSI